MSAPSTPPNPRRRWLRIIAIAAVLWLVGSWMAEGLGMKPVATRTAHEWPYELRYDTYSGFGHRATRTTVYYKPGRERGVLVASRVGKRFPLWNDASRLLYEHCPDGPGPTCGVHLFEGRTGRSRRVSERARILNWGIAGPWSIDGSTVALLEQFEGTVVDLESGRAVELREPLGLREPRRQITDGAMWTRGVLYVRVAEYAEGPPYVHAKTSTYRVDAREGTVRRIR